MVKIFYKPYIHTWDRDCGSPYKNCPLKKSVIVRTNLFELILKITLFFSGTFLENPATSIPGVDVAHYSNLISGAHLYAANLEI